MLHIVAKLSARQHKVSLLLLVYALHIFLFLTLTAFSTPANAGVVVIKAASQSQKPHHHQDPASVECRSLFKYDDSKQQLTADHFPLAALLSINLYSSPSITSAGISASPLRQLSDGLVKRYRLLGVFLI